jgi:hypothetical protein
MRASKYTRRLAVEDLGPERVLHRLLPAVRPAHADRAVLVRLQQAGR